MTERLFRLTYRLSMLLVRTLLRICTRWEVEGASNLPASGPVIMVGNHVHIIDPALAAAAVRRQVHPMAKRELFEIPLIGWYFWWLGAFPVRRFSGDMGALRAALAYLRRDEVVLMFPEGTRTRTGALQPALPGAAMVALLARAPIVPVGITGSDIRLPGALFSWIRGRRPTIRAVVGEPFTLDDARADSAGAEAATDQMMRRIAELLPEPMRGVYAEREGDEIVVRRQAREANDGEPVSPRT